MKFQTRTIAEIGIAIALFVCLDYLNIRLPINLAGGTISLAMVPILILALLRGPVVGILTGILCGLVDLALQPYVLNIFQVFLDYPCAFGAVGIAGFMAGPAQRALQKSSAVKAMPYWVVGIVLGVLGRFICAFFSGIIFFASNAPKGQNVALYSAGYQASYLVPSLIGCLVVCMLALPALNRAVKGYTNN